MSFEVHLDAHRRSCGITVGETRLPRHVDPADGNVHRAAWVSNVAGKLRSAQLIRRRLLVQPSLRTWRLGLSTVQQISDVKETL